MQVPLGELPRLASGKPLLALFTFGDPLQGAITNLFYLLMAGTNTRLYNRTSAAIHPLIPLNNRDCVRRERLPIEYWYTAFEREAVAPSRKLDWVCVDDTKGVSLHVGLRVETWIRYSR